MDHAFSKWLIWLEPLPPTAIVLYAIRTFNRPMFEDTPSNDDILPH